MALINELIKKIADPVLKERINTELERLNKQKKFGLVFEDHVPEYISLHEVPVLKGSKVTYRDNSTDQTFIVLNIDGEKVRCINRETKEIKIAEISELVTIAEFGDPIYPYLKKIDFIKNNPESDLWHILIEADNYHALQLLEYVYSGKIDCIYIDPPYNSGASDWKYNNNYVDKTDAYKHSKWLSMLEKRLRLSKRLLNPKESVLICTIDEKEYHHLGCLLEEVFPEAKIQMLTNVINPKGVARDYGFSRVEEYIYIVYVGTQTIQPGIEDMLREKNDGGKPVRWASLQRSGSNSRRFEGPTMFYPIFFNKDDKSFHSTGESLPLNLDRNTVIAPEGTIAVFPLGRNNDERNWQLSQETFNERLSRGFVKFGKWNEAKNSRSISYLSTGVINRIASGELKILGYEQDGAAIIENVSTIRPVSTWNKPTHSASEYGSSLLNHIMPDRKFPFPKSLYAVADTLKFFVSNKKDALILDFFAGSGTTAHAVNLLNKEDGGKRQSIMVTNNEVSVDESKSLKKKGFNPGDIEWEDLGIAHHITWPRIKCSILGIDTVGSPLTDTYKITRKKQVLVPRKIKKIDYVTPETLDTVTKRKNFVSNLNSKYSDLTQSLVKKDEPFIVSDEHSTTIIFDIEYLEEWLNEIEGKDHIQNFLIITNNNKEFNNIKDKVADLMGENQSIIEEELPMSKGFDTNAIFFKLGFLDKNSVAIGKQLSKLLPLLWMKAGSVGECPSIGENENVDALIYPKNKFGILIKENRFADFKNELDEYPEINTVFIVTDSDEGYVEMSSLLEVKQTFQLYKDYLDNFRINIRR